MSELIRLLERLSQLAIVPLLAALALAVLAVVVVHNWRIALPAMVAHYVAVAALLVRVIDPAVVLIKLVAGVVTCIALIVASVGADNLRRALGAPSAAQRLAQPNWVQVPAQLALRAVAAVVVGATTVAAAVRFPLPGVPPVFVLSAYLLFGWGLLVIVTSFEALNSGLGVLLLLSAFEVAYIPLEPSVSVGVLLGAITLLVGIAVAFLVLAEGGRDETTHAPLAERSESRA